MASGLPTTKSLEALQSKDQRKIMDLVDRLRRAGLSSLLQLPQIVVCGDQSSGKSSVLEAITEIPFPKRENLCTRFATEIIMRRDKNESIRCKINPDKNRPDEEKQALRAFSHTINDFSELPALIDEATGLMGLSDGKAFARDVLSVEICGPGRPQLTLVDLPGLIHSANKSQSDADVELIKSIVQEYISNERTIILAVISAKNDYANQVILERCRKIDPKGARTLGIITKPDFLRAGSDNERAWLDLAQNRDVFFELGWHMLKNRADDELHLSFEQRNVRETAFFAAGSYAQLPPHMTGVDTLRVRLSKLLYGHLKRELPVLKTEMDGMLASTVKELELLGQKRTDIRDQRLFLMKVCVDAHGIMNAAVGGTYSHQFFGYVDPKASVDDHKNIRRLRAVVQYLNLKFASTMRERGRKFAIVGMSDPGMDATLSETPADKPQDEPTEDNDDQECSDTVFSGTSIRLSRVDAVKWVQRLLERSRGTELVGVFNPQLIGQLFREQSENWGAIAKAHINRVAQTCRDFVLLTLDSVTTEDVKDNLVGLTIDRALKDAHSAALQELQRILDDKERAPSTYNHYFTTTLQKMQREKYEKRMAEAAKVAKPTNQLYDAHRREISDTVVSHEAFRKAMDQSIELDMDKYSAEQALDVQAAFYKDESKYFVDVVTKQAIERHLVAPLASILSPMVMAALPNDEVEYIAAEPEEIVTRRDHLEGQRDMLEKGQEAFRIAMGKLR